jgi:hypothetical protein
MAATPSPLQLQLEVQFELPILEHEDEDTLLTLIPLEVGGNLNFNPILKREYGVCC